MPYRTVGRTARGPELPSVQIMSSLADESATPEVNIATGILPRLFALAIVPRPVYRDGYHVHAFVSI
jgi:hypothetical protein